MEAAVTGAKKRKTASAISSLNHDKRPRVHAQRKFAQGQAILPLASPLKATKSNGGQSSGSSTASGPTSSKTATKLPAAEPPGECPKTEDFITFLCLRGTSLCPPELDFFNRATIVPGQSSGDEESNGETNTEKRRKQRAKMLLQKPLPESVRALKKKYTEQRLARSVVTQKLEKASAKVDLKMSTRGSSKKPNEAAALKSVPGLRRGLRSSRATRAAVRNSSMANAKIMAKRKPSAATIIAKRKTRMATLTAASKGVSRMLTRLTPRGTSSAAFVRKAKRMPLEGRSLRRREVSVSSDDDESGDDQYQGRKMVCRKTASNVNNSDSDDDSEEEDEEESDEEESEEEKKKGTEEKKRPGRKTKEAATVLLNMLGQKLSRNSAKDDDDISIESLSEATQGKRLVELEKNSKTTKNNVERKLITPSIKKTKKKEADDNESDISSNASKKANKEKSKEKDKKTTKNLLKEMQDRLLEEAKKKIASTPEASPLIQATKTEESEDERITISQRTGYIQVKPRLSTDQMMEDQPQSITQRRLSKNGERTSTPPRKILPKGATPEQTENRPHLPVGVVGAALSSSRPAMVTPLSTTLALKPENSNAVGNLTPPRTVPLSQPLLINTSLNPQVVTSMAQIRPMVTSQHMTQPMQLNAPAGSIIMSSNGIRMPGAMQMQPLQLRPNGAGQIPIIMPQIALANGSILQPVTVSSASSSNAALLRPPFYGQHIMTSIPQFPQHPHLPQQMPQQMTSHLVATSSSTMTSSSASKATTDVTTANTEPLVSPGPPMLSPQYQQQQQQFSTPQQHQQNQRPPPMHPQMAAASKPKTNPPVLTPSGFPVTSGAVIRSMVPSKVKNQFAKMPTAGPSPGQNQVRMSSQQQKPPASKTIFTKGNNPQAGPSSSFKVEDESSPYAFEPEPLEIRPSVPPYRKQSSSKSPKLSSGKMTATGEAGSKKAAKLSESLQSKMDDLSANFKDLDGSIPLPAELASQLVAQAQAEGASASNETTYFIPLQSNSSGQSFGVAVKLGTEGPPGPDQKVIMKAKLVTQPVGKPLGAKIISATKAKESKGKKKVASSSSSSSSDSSESESSSSDEKSKKKKKHKKKHQKKKPRLSSPEVTPPSKKKYARKEATIVPLPVTSPTISSRSHQTCIGTVEAMEKFPKLGQHAHLLEAPVYKPTEAEFKDPMKYIAAIRKEAEPFGMCKIIPPSSFKPECNVDDDMRFTGYNQYVHKLMNRWGPNSKEMAAIKKYLDTQNVTINAANHPMVSGVEIDLPALYHAVQSLGGLTEVIQKKKWGKIAEFLRVPKGTQDRSNKFYDIYCKFLLPYDTLSKVEREELLRLVDEEFEERNKDKLNKSKNSDKDSDDSDDSDDEEDEEDDEDDECVLKGKSTSLSAFFRVARNLMSMVFKDKFAASNPGAPGSDYQPDLQDVEEEYWRLVQDRDCHIQVQQGSIDTGSGSDGYGFPTSRGSSCGRHPWNLKILSNNHKSILRTMGPVMGVTVPTLHLGMLFTTGCWYRDPHGLPWIEYHHTGAPKIWFSIPDSHSIAFYTAMKLLSPTFCRKKKIWLGQDTVMMPPNLLVKHGVSVSRVIQEAGQFIIVFPKAYSSHVCTGYTVSESVYFATRDYLKYSETEFENIRDSRDPMLFPLPKLLLCIAKAEKSSKKTLKLIKPLLEKIRDNEYVKRTMISDLGVKATERINLRSGSKNQQEEDEYECETCSANLYISFVCDLKEDRYYCLDDAVKYLQTRKAAQRKNCKLLFTHSKEEISTIIKDVNRRLEDEDSSDDSDTQQIATRRISELGKEVKKERDPELQPLASTSKSLASPPSSSVKQRLSAPNVPPGTSINVSSFSLVKHAAKKAMEGKSKKPPAKPEPESEADDESESEEDDDQSEEESDEESDSDSEVQISKEAIKKAEKIKKAEGKKAKIPTPNQSKYKRKAPTPKSSAKGEAKQRPAKKADTKSATKTSAKNEKAASSSSSRRRPTKARKAASSKTGNLASELLDMLLSTSNEESNDSESEQDSSDEAWK